MLMAIITLLATVTSEIKVDLRLDASDFVAGEKIRGVVNIINSSPSTIIYGREGVPDSFFVEVFRANDNSELDRTSKGAFVTNFKLKTGEGVKLETFLARHFALSEPSRYLAKPVLVHDGMRYEGQLRAFDVVEGVRVGGAMQMFANNKELQREFELVCWSRGNSEHLFVKARDNDGKRWDTRDLGLLVRSDHDKPTVSVLTTGEVIILNRCDRDWFTRTTYWSLPKRLVFRGQENVEDPETAGTKRVRELYKEGVKPVENPWWKFW